MEKIDVILTKRFEELQKQGLRGFTKIPNRVIVDSKLTPRNLRVYSVLLMHLFRKETCFPSYSTIAKEVGLKKRQSVIPHIKKLIELGYIKKERRTGKSNIYTPIIK